jgi:TonB family protein
VVDAPPAAAAAPAAPEPPAGPIPGKIYSADDANVRPPVVVRQDVPNVPQGLMTVVKPRGLVEVVIDEQGRVIGMTMRTSIHPTYDAQILSAARDWKYQPARLGNEPVRFRRLISVAVRR